MLEQAGITVDKFGGEAFRAAVSDGEAKLAKLLLEKGADINYHKPDMMFPYASHPCHRGRPLQRFPYGALARGKGADITIADKYGNRPYTVAVQNKNQELADYLKALEPEDWHNEKEKIRQLMPYKLPAKLVEYLKTGPFAFGIPEQEWVKWAELYSYMDVQEMTWKRKSCSPSWRPWTITASTCCCGAPGTKSCGIWTSSTRNSTLWPNGTTSSQIPAGI